MSNPTELLAELGRVAHITLPEPLSAPDGWWLDREGRAVRLESIKPYEVLREQTLRPLVERHLALYLELADLKARYYEDIATLIEICYQEHGVLLEGKHKKNSTLYLFDGSFRIERKYQDRTRYDESIGAAEQLIRNCLDDWSSDANPEVRALILSAFERNKQGELRRAEMIRLRDHNFDDPRWTQAMAIIADAERSMSAACYITVSIRDKLGAYHPLPLDLAAVPPHKRRSAPTPTTAAD